jgi:hypothetical protein
MPGAKPTGLPQCGQPRSGSLIDDLGVVVGGIMNIHRRRALIFCLFRGANSLLNAEFKPGRKVTLIRKLLQVGIKIWHSQQTIPPLSIDYSAFDE